MKKLLLLTFLILIIVGCDKKKSAINKIDDQFKLSLNELTGSNHPETSIYIVIPRAGCSGCISTAEGYMIDCLKDSVNTNKTFILTDYDSEKLMKARFGTLYKSKRLIRDPKNYFKANKSLKSIYPTIYMFDKDSNLKAVSEISPSKNGLAEMNMFLKASTI